MSGASIAGMVCGILSLLFWAAPIFGLVLGIVGVAMGAKGMKAADAGLAKGKGMGIAGLVTGIIGTIIGAVWTVWWIYLISTFGYYYSFWW